MKRLLPYLIALVAAATWANDAWAQVAAPSDLVVVPRYDGGTISMVLSWTDNAHGADNEQGFEVQRREVGGAFATIANPGINATDYEDAGAAGDRWWEYRVRATHSVVGDSPWSNVSAQNSPRQTWPINNGEHNVLYTHAQPITAGGSNYFHGGTDISGAGNQVDVGRGGIVTAINNSVGGTLEMDVDYGALGLYEDMYLHTDIDAALRVGDNLLAGDTVGNISTTYFNHADKHHVHWGLRWHNLAKFTVNADQDPNTTAPVVADTNADGDDFIVVAAAANDHTNPREPAWGEIDFLVDAYDDMTPGNNNRAAPLVTGYWIQAGVPDGEDVRNGTDYYRLLNFDMERTSYSGATGVENDVFYTALPGDLQGANIWGVYLTWIPTNAGDIDGALGNVDGSQFWKTDARKATGARPNGSDAAQARENQEARFPDGTYFVHVMLEDFIHTSDTVRSVLVDNSRPYVERVTVYSGARIVYQAQWVWDGAAAQLEVQPATFDAAAAFSALRTQDVTIEVEFSEPMASAAITAITPSGGASALGVPVNLISTDPAHARLIWRGLISNLDIADDGSHDGTHVLTIDGTDLAGNSLLQVSGRASMGADHHNRDGTGALRGTAGLDTIHGFRVGPLEGVIPLTAIFMKQTAADPVTPSVAAKALAIETALNDYYDEVSYAEISFAVSGFGWYQLDHALDWYETTPRNPLIDLVEEAIAAAEADGVPLGDYVVVVTDEDVARTEWSTNGAWPYTVGTPPGWRLMAGGTMNLASPDARTTNLAGRMVGLIDLFAYPEVSVARPFVGPWSHMSDQDTNVHVLGWEKWRVGWLDETGTATGKTLTRVPKPAVASPVTDSDYTINAMDADTDAVKLVAIEIGDRLYYTAEYRRQQNLDNALPNAGVVITKANERINQGEGPVIVQESDVTAGDLADAPFVAAAPREVFDDVGSGVNIEVISVDPNQAQIRLNYALPPTENDVYVSDIDGRWKTIDIWVDAPGLAGEFEADPLTVIDAEEPPVVGEVNKVYGRVRNQGHADATNFEVHLEIREPWGAGGPWRSLTVETVPLLQGTDTSAGAYHLVTADWIPVGDIHSCVRLSVEGVANDVNLENNWTQENISQFTTTSGSPFDPVTTRFEVENPYDETIMVFFRLDGLPESWGYILSPERLSIPARGVGAALVTLQPHEAAPLCSQEVITVSAHTPRVDTLKELGAITLQVGLKNPAGIDAQTRLVCGQMDPKATTAQLDRPMFAQQCVLHTQGCTDPALPNTQVAVVYTAPDGSKQVQYVTTDENGCYVDTLSVGEPGRWETEVVLEETDCREAAAAPTTTVDVPPTICGGSIVCCWMLLALAIALIATLLWLARWLCGNKRALLPFLIALAVTLALGWWLFTRCSVASCWLWLAITLAVLFAVLILCLTRVAPCFGRQRSLTHSE
jgi:hypothetical protein